MLTIRRIVGESMYPTYKEGQIVVGLKSNYYKTGQVIIAKQGGKEVIKRITAINNGYYNLMGDNLARSTDSRQMGAVKHQQILGRVIFVL